MKLTQKLGIAALALVSATTIGVVSANAQTTPDQHNTLIQNLASKLGVSQEKVQIAFNEIHTEQQAQRQLQYETKLSQLVTDGKITEAQKQLILAKQKELQTQREQNKAEFQNLTKEERRTRMASERTTLQTWAKENNIDMQYLRFGMDKGGHGRGGEMGPRGMGDKQPTVSPTLTQ